MMAAPRAADVRNWVMSDDAAFWLALLRDGTPDERALARTELGLILERRGMLAEAAEAY